MKRFFILATIALFCSTGSINAQDFLIDNTYMTPYEPVIPTYTHINKRFNNGTRFEGQEERVKNKVTGYRGALYMADGSYFYCMFDAHLRPINSGWYVKDNIPYYNTYDKFGNCIRSKRIETGGNRFYLADFSEYGLRYYGSDYSTGSSYDNGSYNSGSYNSSSKNKSSSSSYKQKNRHPKTCTKCVGRGVCTTCSGRGIYKPNLNGSYMNCSICSGTGKCSLCNGTGKHGWDWY